MRANKEKGMNRLTEMIKKHQELIKTKDNLEAFIASSDTLNVDSLIVIKNYINLLGDLIQNLQIEILRNDAWDYFDDLF